MASYSCPVGTGKLEDEVGVELSFVGNDEGAAGRDADVPIAQSAAESLPSKTTENKIVIPLVVLNLQLELHPMYKLLYYRDKVYLSRMIQTRL